MTAENSIFGLHAVLSVLQHHPERVSQLVVSERHDQKIQAIIDAAKEQHIAVRFAARADLDKLTDAGNHQGVVAICTTEKNYTENDLEHIIETADSPFLLILDQVQDPHNLGACLRSADAAGVHAVIAPRDKSVGLTPVVRKVSCGASEVVPFIQVTNLARTLRYLKDKGIWIYGAAADAKKNVYQMNFSGPVALVLGAEGAGLRRLTQDHCDELANIPMSGSVSSLNVSVAAGVFLFEVVRQRMK